MSEHADAELPLLVSCLCAAWCRTCDEYRVTFDALLAEFDGWARFVWVDIEDDEAALGSVDVVDFPTLLIARGDTAVFFGPVMPHAQTARQLIERSLAGALGEVADATLEGLPSRIRGLR
jgi:thiol-disulfide isomerase/thioredoxin